jgi:hypothetical protein
MKLMVNLPEAAQIKKAWANAARSRAHREILFLPLRHIMAGRYECGLEECDCGMIEAINMIEAIKKSQKKEDE